MEHEIMNTISEMLDKKLDEKLVPILNSIDNIKKIHAKYDHIFKMIEDKNALPRLKEGNVSDDIKRITDDVAAIRINMTEISEALSLVEQLTARTAEDIEKLHYMR